MKKVYLVWNLTNYDLGYEFLGAFTSKTKATKAYNNEMKKRYGTTNIDKLFDLWDDAETGCADSWKITEVEVREK